MSNNFKSTILSAVVLLSTFLGIGLLNGVLDRYTRTTEVIAIDGDMVLVEDTCGYIWGFYGDGYEIGDRLILKMDTNHTDNYIEDDIIVKVVKGE